MRFARAFWFSVLGLACLSACRTGSSPSSSARASAEPLASSAKGAERANLQRFGEPVSAAEKPMPVAAVLAAPDRFQGPPLLVEGKVRKACSRKGCWMELAEAADPKAPGCRVTFKDYGFFVPTDSAGSSARVQAQLETRTLRPTMVAHLEREGATFAHKASDGSAREVSLVATGVELWR
jgi:hypothetical protein